MMHNSLQAYILHCCHILHLLPIHHTDHLSLRHLSKHSDCSDDVFMCRLRLGHKLGQLTTHDIAVAPSLPVLVVENGAAKVHIAKIGVAEIDAAKINFCRAEVHATKVHLAEIDSFKIDIFEAEVEAEVCTSKVAIAVIIGDASEIQAAKIDAWKFDCAEIDIAEQDAEVDTRVEIEGRRLTRADNADGVGERKGFQRVSERLGKCRGDGLEGPREVARWTYTAHSGKACHRKAHHVCARDPFNGGVADLRGREAE